MKDKIIPVRCDEEDLRILSTLKKKLGMNNSAIFRHALRRLLAEEKKRE